MLTPRIFVGTQPPPSAGGDYALGLAAARHVAQALRMRVGDRLSLFTGEGGEFPATISRIDRAGVVVRVARHDAVEREAPAPVEAPAAAKPRAGKVAAKSSGGTPKADDRAKKNASPSERPAVSSEKTRGKKAGKKASSAIDCH